MSLLDQLSSARGDRTQASNRAVADRVVQDPALLRELATGLSTPSSNLLGDLVEVFTMTAQEKPEDVAPYADAVAPHLAHKEKRVRWEAAHTLALVAAIATDTIARLSAKLEDQVRRDDSMIVRGYLLQALGEYAGTSAAAAKRVFPFLVEALDLWDGEHAHLALDALGKAAVADPSLAKRATAVARKHETHEAAKVKKAAKAVLKRLQKPKR